MFEFLLEQQGVKVQLVRIFYSWAEEIDVNIDLGAQARAFSPRSVSDSTSVRCNKTQNLQSQGNSMKKLLSLIMAAAIFCAAPAFAADPVLGTWKLNVSKSKFGDVALTAGTRVYTESKGIYKLEQKVTGADGKERSSTSTYSDGKEEKQAATNTVGDAVAAKKIDANTWDFEVKKNGKVVGHVHRVVSADGKTLTVQNSGAKMSGGAADETLVFEKQ